MATRKQVVLTGVKVADMPVMLFSDERGEARSLHDIGFATLARLAQVWQRY
jgi:hypothetical protein